MDHTPRPDARAAAYLTAARDDENARTRPHVALDIERLATFIDHAIAAIPPICGQNLPRTAEIDASTRRVGSALRTASLAVRQPLAHAQRHLRTALADLRDEQGMRRLPTRIQMVSAATEVPVPEDEVFPRSDFSAA